MDADLKHFLAERFDAIDRRLDRIEHQLRSRACDGGEPCHRCERCRHGACCDRCRHEACGGRGCCGRPDCRCGDGAGGALRAFGEAQALLGAFERARDESQWRALNEVRESVHLLSRRVSALERRQCCGGSPC